MSTLGNSSTHLLDDLSPSEDWLNPQWTPEQRAEWDLGREQGAARLRERLSSEPFYANRAQACKDKTGSDLDYWLDLLSSRPRYPM